MFDLWQCLYIVSPPEEVGGVAPRFSLLVGVPAEPMISNSSPVVLRRVEAARIKRLTRIMHSEETRIMHSKLTRIMHSEETMVR